MHRLRRPTNFKPHSFRFWAICRMVQTLKISWCKTNKQTRDTDWTTSFDCWTTVADGVPTLKQRWINNCMFSGKQRKLVYHGWGSRWSLIGSSDEEKWGVGGLKYSQNPPRIMLRLPPAGTKATCIMQWPDGRGNLVRLVTARWSRSASPGHATRTGPGAAVWIRTAPGIRIGGGCVTQTVWVTARKHKTFVNMYTMVGQRRRRSVDVV